MELDEFISIWSAHEQKSVESTKINKDLLRKLLIQNADKRVDWLKIRTLSSLVLILILTIIIAIPRIQFTLDFKHLIGILLFGSIYILTFIWAVRLYLLIEKLNMNDSLTSVSKHLRIVEKYKLKNKKYGFILAPFMIIGIFLSSGMHFLSVKMIPFYVACLFVFLVSQYLRSKHGLLARIKKLEKDIDEISKLEAD